MLNVKIVKLIDSRDIFNAIKYKFGEDVEGIFNEIYCPSSDGAVLFSIPYNDKELKEIGEWEQYIVDILMNECGFSWGESCYLKFNY